MVTIAYGYKNRETAAHYRQQERKKYQTNMLFHGFSSLDPNCYFTNPIFLTQHTSLSPIISRRFEQKGKAMLPKEVKYRP
jgi:hypothetical protein